MTGDRLLEDAALGLVYLVVVDGGIAAAHQTVFVELPQLVAVAAPPLSINVPALVLEPDRDAVLRKTPEVLLQPIVPLPGPLASQKVPDGLPAREELVAVAPLGVLGVGEGDLLGIAGVPRVLGRLHLLPRSLLVERRYRRSDALVLPALLHALLLSALMLAAYDSYADATAALGSSAKVWRSESSKKLVGGAHQAAPH